MSRSRSAAIASSSARSKRRLAGLDGVEQAAVIAREDRPGDKRLVGYVTGHRRPRRCCARALAELLPAYMVPAAVVALPDAAADAQRQAGHPRAAGAGLHRTARVPRPAPRGRGGSGRHLRRGARVWTRVGVDDSFFDLGGDSISSMQVVTRARAAGVVCRPRDVFVEQTVAGLARVVGCGQRATAGVSR